MLFRSYSPKRKISFENVLKFDATNCAQQLTLIECSLLRDIEIIDLLKKCQTGSSTSPALEGCSNHFNRVCLWVATIILTSQTLAKQIICFQKLLKVAKRLFRMRNYSTCAQIISGLQDISITRLKHLSEVGNNSNALEWTFPNCGEGVARENDSNPPDPSKSIVPN